VLDGLAVVLLVLVVVLALAVSSAARRWAVGTLGYGWAPVLLWATAALATLRYRPRLLFRYWRIWIMAADLVAMTVLILAYFYPAQGPMSQTSLGGTWGTQLVGTPPVFGLVRLAAIALLTPAVLYPHRVGLRYLHAMHQVGASLQSVTLSLLPAQRRERRSLGRRLRQRLFLMRRRAYWRRWWRGARASLASFMSRRRPPAEPVPAVSQATNAALPPAEAAGEPATLFNGSSPGTIPQLDSNWGDSNGDNSTSSPAQTVQNPASTGTAKQSPQPVPKPVVIKSRWKLPPAASILAQPEPHNMPQGPLQQMSRLIETTLAEHGVIVEVKDVKAGPRVVRFGLVPGWVTRRGEPSRGEAGQPPVERSRVKVQAILTREKDLALALKTPYLRIEAPVPGEALVGLEVPNPVPSKVPLRAVMDNPVFRKLAAKGISLPLALGQDTAGAPVALDLAALPHVLIAGATGSGKSVCINSIVASLLLTRPPDQVRMVMIDPKRVELTPFNGIPHLITPVIVEVEEVNPALRGLMREMFRRYKQMEEAGTRNIVGYNAKAKDRMPYLVLVVDELADLMMVGGFEIEQNLVRLAQLGRATGIHLVLATQRPSVNVVTGLLKANIAARVAFAVASQVDSRVILDTVGAEKLLGKGDMLLLSNDSPKPRRVQGAMVYDEEIDELVKFWLEQKGPPLPEISIADPDEEGEDEEEEDVDDRMLDQARELALRNPRLSASLLERRLRIGGRRANQILETLEDEGLVVGQR
jgi:S-DNA-T family DNA segregation ATPase FtsK/SpoIIIE